VADIYNQRCDVKRRYAPPAHANARVNPFATTATAANLVHISILGKCSSTVEDDRRRKPQYSTHAEVFSIERENQLTACALNVGLFSPIGMRRLDRLLIVDFSLALTNKSSIIDLTGATTTRRPVRSPPWHFCSLLPVRLSVTTQFGRPQLLMECDRAVHA
jgi:hypothetical protein